jgi:hypothetical protein
VDTSYPFTDTVRITLSMQQPAEFGVALRIPAWCDAATLTVAGGSVPATADERGYAIVRRHWNDGDVIELTLPMHLRTVPRDRGAVGLRLGPLVMVHGIEEIWRPVPDHKGLAEWEIIPRSMWNCGVWLDDPAGLDSWPIERRPVSAVPFAAETAALVVHGNGAMLRDWQLLDNSAGPVPDSPASTQMPILPIRLLPYGAARLRVAELPTVLHKADGH